MGSLTLFYLFAALVIVCSVMVISLKNAVTSAVFLIADLFLLAALYAQMGADFIAGIQVLVYAGAILVLFLFVIMLLNYESGSLEEQGRLGKFEKFFCFGMMGMMGVFTFGLAARHEFSSSSRVVTGAGEAADNTYELGVHLFSKYLWPFELASLLILLAMVASIMIAKKKPRNDARALQPSAKE